MKKIVAMVLGILCLAGCGKRGNLDFPVGATYPRQYPVSRLPKSGQMKPVDPQAVEKQTETGTEEKILTKTEE